MLVYLYEPFCKVLEGLQDGLIVNLLHDQHGERRLVPVELLAAGVRDRPGNTDIL